MGDFFECVGERGAGDGDGLACFWGWEDLEGEFCEDAEAADGAGEEFGEVEAGGIFDDLAAAADDLA